MNARQIFVRVVLGSALILGAVGEMTFCAGQEAAKPRREAEATRPGRAEMEGFGKKIRTAVEAGEMTEAEGRAKWEAYLKSIGADRARRPRRGGRDEAEWRELLEELEAKGIGKEKLRELFRKRERGEALDPDEAEALEKVIELRKKLGQERGERQRRPGDRVLDRWLGTWLSEVIINPCAWVPEGKQLSQIREAKWILNGRFQEVTVRSDDHEARETQRSEAGGKRYAKWTFDSNGGHGYWTGTWDEESKTMTWKLDFGVVKGTMVDSFTDEESYRYVTKLVLRDAEGKALLDTQSEHTRLLEK